MGFSKDRFMTEVESAYLCGVCKDVLNKPKFIKIQECEHLFCEDCLQMQMATGEEDGVFTCPHDNIKIAKEDVREPIPFFTNLYVKLQIRCSFFEQCQTTTIITEIENHERECDHNQSNFVFCQDLCGIRINLKDVPTHNCGAYFREVLQKMNDQIAALEVTVAELKKQPMRGNTATNKHPPQSNGYSVKKVSQTSSSLSSSSTVSSSPRARSDSSCSVKVNLLDQSASEENSKYLLSILEPMIKKFRDFKWQQDEKHSSSNPNALLFVLLDYLALTRDIKRAVRSSGIEKIADREMIKNLEERKINRPNMQLILSLCAMEFLKTEFTPNTSIKLIASNDFTLTPMFAALAGEVARFACHYVCSVRIGKQYKTIPNHEKKIKFTPFTHNDILSNVNTSHKADIIIIFETLTDQHLSELQNILKPQGYMLILDPDNEFKVITKSSSTKPIGECTQILVDREQVPHIEHFGDSS